jgi:leader peptidase (prepilin peptidase)/N-methyltransferase
MAEIFIKIILVGILLFCAIWDVIKKKIFLWSILSGAILIGICLPFCEKFSLWNSIGGFAVGAFVVLVSVVTVGKIGMGDALLLCLTGMALGFWSNLELFAVALLLAAIISIILLVVRLADRKKSIPFVPFILISYLFLAFAG